MMSNYPPGVNELPDDGVVEEEYIFEVGGEVRVMAYSEEHAEELFKQNAGEYLSEAYANGDIDYQ